MVSMARYQPPGGRGPQPGGMPPARRQLPPPDPAVVERANAAILPGDGAFGATMDALRERGLDSAVRSVVAAKRPFLGICVGMQVLFNSSDEYGGAAGLGILPGDVRRFTAAPRVPHMGWNDLVIERTHPFVDGLADGAEFLRHLIDARADSGDGSGDTALLFLKRLAEIALQHGDGGVGLVGLIQRLLQKRLHYGGLLIDSALKSADLVLQRGKIPLQFDHIQEAADVDKLAHAALREFGSGLRIERVWSAARMWAIVVLRP